VRPPTPLVTPPTTPVTPPTTLLTPLVTPPTTLPTGLVGLGDADGPAAYVVEVEPDGFFSGFVGLSSW
jgi:hypothetical protein